MKKYLSSGVLWSLMLTGIFSPAYATCIDGVDEANIHCVSEDGTMEYTTIQAAVDAVLPGQTVQVFPGSYDGFYLNKPGSTMESPITVEAIKIVTGGLEEVAQINGTPHVYSLGRESCVYVDNSDYIIIKGFTVHCVTTDPSSYGIAFRGAFPNDPMFSGQVVGNTISFANKNGIYMSNVNGCNILENEVFSNGEHGIYVANYGADDCTITDNDIYLNIAAGIHFNADKKKRGGDGVQTGHTITGNKIHNNGQNGFNMDGVESADIIDNHFEANAKHAIRSFKIDSAKGPKTYELSGNIIGTAEPFEPVLFSHEQDGFVLTINHPNRYIPIATFTYSCTGLSCTFDASGSYDRSDDADPDPVTTAALSYSWNFGDGLSTIDMNPTTSHTYVVDEIYDVTLTVTDGTEVDNLGDPLNAMHSQEVMVDLPPPTDVEMHVGDLTGASIAGGNGGKWNAEVTITVHESPHTNLDGATVSGTWNAGTNGSGSCTTVAGTCSITKNNINRNTSSVTFTVDNINITSGSNTYDEGANDVLSSIILTKP